MIRITIDTNVLISGLDGSDDQKYILNRLQQLHKDGMIDVAITNRIIQDKATDKNPEQAQRDLEVARSFNIIGSPFRLGIPQDYGVLMDDNTLIYLNNLFNVREDTKKNTIWDIDHLLGHLADNRDYFLTYETRNILNKAPFLEVVGIYVVHPSEFISAIDKILSMISGSPTLLAELVAKDFVIGQRVHPDVNQNKSKEPIINTYKQQERLQKEEARFVSLARNIETEEGKRVYQITGYLRRAGIQSDDLIFCYACDIYRNISVDYNRLETEIKEKYPSLESWIDAIYNPFL